VITIFRDDGFADAHAIGSLGSGMPQVTVV
jgi:hypothetical protein